MAILPPPRCERALPVAHSNRIAWRMCATAVSVVVLSSCFASQQPFVGAQRPVDVPGFWIGFWHGLIAPIAFIVSLFSDHVRVYASPNTGRWYDFGFMLGIGGFSHGVCRGGASYKRVPKQKDAS